MSSTADEEGVKTPLRPSAIVESDSVHDAFRPVLFILSSLTADNIDAAAVARLLQPHFKKDSFYIINAGAFVPQNNSPMDAKKGGGAVSLTSTPGSAAESVKMGVQGELARIAAAREEALQAAMQARAAQVAALQAEYVEDGLSRDDALAAATAELRERSVSDDDSDDTDGDDGGAAGDSEHAKANGRNGPLTRRLPPCVCVLNLRLSCSAIDRFARSIPGVAAVLLLESPCAVRELVTAPSAAAPNGAGCATDRIRGRGGGAGASANSPKGRAGASFTDDVVEYLSGAPVQVRNDGSGLSNVLVQRVEYPTEDAAAPRPAVSPTQFVSTVHTLLLRIFARWQRYEAWRDGRACVHVPPYAAAALRDTDATVEGKTPGETPTPPPDHHLSKRKSATPATPGLDTSLVTPPLFAERAVSTTAAAAYPRTMAEIAAERFEYGAFMQRWTAAQQPNTAHADHHAALHACLAACLHQMGGGHSASALRSRAEAAAAQLTEDIRAATELCATLYTIGTGGSAASGRAQKPPPQLQQQQGAETDVTASVQKVRDAAHHVAFVDNRRDATAFDPAVDLSSAETVEAALSQCMTAEARRSGAADAIAAVYAAVASTTGESDVPHWLRRALVEREQRGWHAFSHLWRSAVVCCLQRPPAAHRVAHAAFVFGGPTTFAQFYRDEDFLEAEERAYELDSSNSESEAEEDEDEEEEEEEREEEDEDELESSAAETRSVDSNDEKASTKATAVANSPTAAKSKSAGANWPAPTTSPVDYAAQVSRQLRRRRIFKQVHSCHARPAVQEMGVAGARCQAVVVETDWMLAADGTLIEVARTAANTCQVRCTVMADTAEVVRGGYMLECPPSTAAATSPPSAAVASNATTAPDIAHNAPQQHHHPQQPLPQSSPELTVESGVRGFLEVDDRLRVFTTVVADNAHAVEVAAYAVAVAAAKETAMAQYEAQFSKGARAAKGRDKNNSAASPLSLEDITASLLAALPPSPSSPSSATATPAAASPPLMRVHALFPAHHCVLTSASSEAAVPGVRLAVLPDSAYAVACNAAMQAAPPLLTVHLWWENQLCTVPVQHLSAAQFYLDGVAELFSPDLPPTVRLVLHPNGSYVAGNDTCRLFVNPRGRCTLYRGNSNTAAAVVVHQLRAGRATAVTNSTICRVEREDGLQREFVSAATAAGANAQTAPPPYRGSLSKTLFGPGASVYKGEAAQTWSWRVAGLPEVTCESGGKRCLAAALDGDGTNRWVYEPDARIFELRVRAANASASKVAATLSLPTCRLTLWGNNADLRSGFVVDCAYGGVCGEVQSTHVYRVSPFGRCSEEVAVAAPGDETRWQLVLPPQFKRPKKKAPEVVLLPEYASEAFHSAIGEGGGSATASGNVEEQHETRTTVMHLQRRPPAALLSDHSERHAAENKRGLDSFFADAVASVANPRGRQVRCAVLNNDGLLSVAVMDAGSWSKYAQWLMRLPQTSLHVSHISPESATQLGLQPALAFEVERQQTRTFDLYPLTVVDEEEEAAAACPASPAQHCVLLHRLSAAPTTSFTAPSWCASRVLSTALEECRHSAGASAAVTQKGGSAVEARSQALGKDGDDALNEQAKSTKQAATPDERTKHPEEQHGGHDAEQTAARNAAACSSSHAALSRAFDSVHYWSSPCCPRGSLTNGSTSMAWRRGAEEEQVDNAAALSTHSAAALSTTDAAPSSVAAAVSGDKGNACSTSATAASSSWRKKTAAPSMVPLMQSYFPPADAQTGTTAASRFHAPLLVVEPRHVDFGNVHGGRRYVATFTLTNASTVPCRYRVRASAVLRPYLTISYPRHFVAPGMTVTATVELSGWQPSGVVDSELTVVHEGGTTEVGVVWCTTDVSHSAKLGRGVACAGWSVSRPVLQHPFKADAAKTETGEVENKEHDGNSDSGAFFEAQTV